MLNKMRSPVSRVITAIIKSITQLNQNKPNQSKPDPAPHSGCDTHSALVSGVGRSPMVVSVRVDQYSEPRYLRVSVEYSPGRYGYTQSPCNTNTTID